MLLKAIAYVWPIPEEWDWKPKILMPKTEDPQAVVWPGRSSDLVQVFTP